MNSDDEYSDDEVNYGKDDYGFGDEVQDQVNGFFYNILIYLERMMMTASSLLAENSSA
jgi:hypothetical protein